jgi:alpha-beta hydrolase superfamily lysophospholipase
MAPLSAASFCLFLLLPAASCPMIRRLPLVLFSLILAGAAATWLAGSMLVAVRPHPVALPADLAGQTLALAAGPGQTVAGSFLPASKGAKGAVLLLHGIHGDRRDMADRARFLHRLGYAVMLIDLPGQGASTAPAVTFGLTEAAGVRVALEELRRRAPGQRIGVIGTSLGAASLLLCRDCPKVDAAVLESMYPTIEEAVQDRLRMRVGALGVPLAKLLLWQLPLRLDIQPSQLRPVERMGALAAPVLVAAGSEDRHTTLAETERIYAAATGPKALWIVPGAAHENLYAYAREAYERRIGGFLARYLDVPR